MILKKLSFRWLCLINTKMCSALISIKLFSERQATFPYIWNQTSGTGSCFEIMWPRRLCGAWNDRALQRGGQLPQSQHSEPAMWKPEDSSVRSVLYVHLSMGVLGTEQRSSGLGSKYFCQLSHLAVPQMPLLYDLSSSLVYTENAGTKTSQRKRVVRGWEDGSE